jgi:hypothetical protein
VARAAEAHRAGAGAEATERQRPEPGEKDEGQQPAEEEAGDEAADRAGLRAGELDALALEQRDQHGVIRLRRTRRIEQLLAGGRLVDAGHIREEIRDALHPTLIDEAQEL